MRRTHSIILASGLAALLAGTGPAAAQPDDDEGMTFEPDDINEPADPVEEGEPIMDDDDGMTFDADDFSDDPEPEPEPDLGLEPEPGEPVDAGGDVALGESRVSWQDIVVVVRKPFLKVNRLELLPTWGVTMNDNIIRHVQFAGQINYFLTDVLAVGVEGALYVKDLREPFDLVARQARRLPTVNKYNYSAALNFHYVPVYGKFAVLDEHIVHWESYFTAGVGFTQTEVIPRDPAFQPFTNFLVTPNVGVSMRFFLTKFLTVNLSIRDYIFVDKFEPVGRGPNMYPGPEQARDNASSSLINNVIFQAGVSFWFPTGFEYTTFR
jgi:outer membrane beta-barrel protein